MMTFMHVVTMMCTDGEYNFSSGLKKNPQNYCFLPKANHTKSKLF